MIRRRKIKYQKQVVGKTKQSMQSDPDELPFLVLRNAPNQNNALYFKQRLSKGNPQLGAVITVTLLRLSNQQTYLSSMVNFMGKYMEPFEIIINAIVTTKGGSLIKPLVVMNG